MKTFIVLGCHRSATSMVAGALHRGGICMGGNFLGPEHYKYWKYPLYEDYNLVVINQLILGWAGGAAYEPPSHEAILNTSSLANPLIETYITTRNQADNWGMKDPRLVLTIDLWMPFLRDPIALAMFRDPVETAKSIVRQGEIVGGFDAAKKVVIEYNNRLRSFLSRYNLKTLNVQCPGDPQDTMIAKETT